MHSTSKALLGFAKGGVPLCSDFNSDPATYLAGLVVRQSSTRDVLSLTSGFKIGVSQGRSLSSSKRTTVLRKGEGVCIRAHLKRSTGVITISSYANLVSGTDDSITVGATVFTAQAGAATPGDATFQAATSNAATAISLAAQINAHATASTLVYAVVTSSGVVTLYAIVEGVGTGHDVAVAYTDNDTNVGAVLSGLSGGKLTGGSATISDIAYIAIGAKAYINDKTGKLDIAMSGFSTVSDAMYVTTEISGIDEDGVEVAAALVDMQGGL